jgi:hypothetical protein
MMLDKRGNSSSRERIILMERLLSCLDADQQSRIRYLLMDREFGSTQWLNYLRTKPFHFIIRIRKDAKVRMPGKTGEIIAHRLFQRKNYTVLRKPRIVFGHRLYMAGQKLSGKEYLILISDEPLYHGRKIYGERWGIEVFFGAFKKRGFNFEDTHLTKLERINTLVFILAIAFIWALKTGEFMIDNGHQIPIKVVKERRVRLYSIFRVGLDRLKLQLLNNLRLWEEIYFLSCTLVFFFIFGLIPNSCFKVLLLVICICFTRQVHKIQSCQYRIENLVRINKKSVKYYTTYEKSKHYDKNRATSMLRWEPG